MPILDYGQYEPDNHVLRDYQIQVNFRKVIMMAVLLVLCAIWWYGLFEILKDLGIL